MCKMCEILGVDQHQVGIDQVEKPKVIPVHEKLQRRLEYHLKQVHTLERMIRLHNDNPSIEEFEDLYLEYSKIAAEHSNNQ